MPHKKGLRSAKPVRDARRRAASRHSGAAKAPRPSRAPLGPLLFACSRQLDEIAQAEVNREAGERVARPSVMRLLPFLDFAGIRPSALAKRVDVTKQAISQALALLEKRGLVRYTPDPEDGRAHLVRLTAKGAAAFEHGHSVLRFYERELRCAAGDQALDALTLGLRAIAPVLERWQAEGAPRRAL